MIESLQDEVKRLRTENEYLKNQLIESTSLEEILNIEKVPYKESQIRTFNEIFDFNSSNIIKESYTFEEIYNRFFGDEKLQEEIEEDDKKQLSESQLQEKFNLRKAAAVAFLIHSISLVGLGTSELGHAWCQTPLFLSVF